MRSLTNVLDEELKLYLLSMLQLQEETQHADQMVMQDEEARMLWAEDSKLLGNMDLLNALAAFFHLCFDLKYPKVKKVSMLETL